MIPLAAIEPKLIFWLIIAVIGFINWVSEKMKKGSGSGSPQPPSAPRQSGSGTGDSSEQERLRRFMESLGVPQPQQPRQMPAAQKPQPYRGTAVARARDRKPQPAANIFRPKQPRAAAPQPEMQNAGRIEEAASSIERISGEFGAMNVRVAMPPVQTLDRPARLASANVGTTSVLEREGNPFVASLRRTLTNPTDIRAAFLAAELLGPPRGLQR